MTALTCGGCRWAKPMPGQINALGCFAKPPTVLPMQGGIGGGLNLLPLYPPVQKDTPACAEFSFAPEPVVRAV